MKFRFFCTELERIDFKRVYDAMPKTCHVYLLRKKWFELLQFGFEIYLLFEVPVSGFVEDI